VERRFAAGALRKDAADARPCSGLRDMLQSPRSLDAGRNGIRGLYSGTYNFRSGPDERQCEPIRIRVLSALRTATTSSLKSHWPRAAENSAVVDLARELIAKNRSTPGTSRSERTRRERTASFLNWSRRLTSRCAIAMSGYHFLRRSTAATEPLQLAQRGPLPGSSP